MTEKTLPSVEYLRKRLRYEPETGKLYWRDDPTKRQNWRTMWAGREAFTAKNEHGYHLGALDYKMLKAHRVIWALVYGRWPQGEIDHINRVRDDNRIENLREANPKEQRRNMSKHKHNTSGVMGVSFDKARGLWRANVWENNKQVYLGRFKTMEEAIKAREDALTHYGYCEGHGT